MKKRIAGIVLAGALASGPIAASPAFAQSPDVSAAPNTVAAAKPAGKYVTVKAGDTLSKIAARNNTTWQNLAKINGLSNANLIYPTQKIYITGKPSAVKPAAPKPVSAAPAASSGSKVVDQAKKYLGVPYVYGGSSPSGFDCSGLTQYVFKKLGKSIPRVADAQYHAAAKVSSPKKGDLVFVHDKSGYVYHVAIYVNSSTWLESPRPGKVVHYTAPWTKSVSYGRFAV